LFPLAQEISEPPRLRADGRWELVLTFSAPRQVDSVLLREDPRPPPRVQTYIIQALIDGKWKQVASGAAVGGRKIDRFPSIRAAGVRVHFTSARAKVAAKPAIERFAAFSPDWSGKPEPQVAFLGVPEKEKAGLTERVEPASFEDYLRAKHVRGLKAEELHDGFIYYAWPDALLHAHDRLRRYKAKLPDKEAEAALKEAQAAARDWKFLGIPDSQRAHPARQPIIMSVLPASYHSYLADRKAGVIIAQERHDKWQYWAVRGHLCAGEAIYATTQRYRAEIPGERNGKVKH
jgi:hypothetical protein